MRKVLLTLSLILLSLIMTNIIDAQELPSLKEKKILFTYGGWDGHEPMKCLNLLVPWLKSEGAIVDTSYTLTKYADSVYMAGIDLVIQIHTMSSITGEQERGLLNAVKRGMGIAGWHGGLGDAFRNNTEYQFMVGGQWVAHPGGIVDYTVQITDKKDPVTKGLSDFKMHSEQYFLHVDPNIKVLATTTFSGEHADWIDECVMPVTWKKTYGKGRVFYTSLGHAESDLRVPEVLEMLQRGIKWSSGSKYEAIEKWVNPVY